MKGNIQNFPGAIKLIEYAVFDTNTNISSQYHTYYVPEMTMLYQVNPVNGSIIGHACIMNITFRPVEEKPITGNWDEMERQYYINNH